MVSAALPSAAVVSAARVLSTAASSLQPWWVQPWQWNRKPRWVQTQEPHSPLLRLFCHFAAARWRPLRQCVVRHCPAVLAHRRRICQTVVVDIGLAAATAHALLRKTKERLATDVADRVPHIGPRVKLMVSRRSNVIPGGVEGVKLCQERKLEAEQKPKERELQTGGHKPSSYRLFLPALPNSFIIFLPTSPSPYLPILLSISLYRPFSLSSHLVCFSFSRSPYSISVLLAKSPSPSLTSLSLSFIPRSISFIPPPPLGPSPLNGDLL